MIKFEMWQNKTKQNTQHKYVWTENKYYKLILEMFSPADQS